MPAVTPGTEHLSEAERRNHVRQFIQLHNLDWAEIARVYGYSLAALYKMGVPARRPGQPGRYPRIAQETRDLILELIPENPPRGTYAKLAGQYGLDPSTVRNIAVDAGRFHPRRRGPYKKDSRRQTLSQIAAE
jgi:hypothetical protein